MRSVQRRMVTAVLVAALGAGGLLACTPVRSSDADGFDPSAGPDTVSEASWAYSFSSMEEMAATADVVVSGTVGAVGPGRSVGDVAGPIHLRNAHLRVDEVFKGDVEPNQQLVVEEWGRDATGRSFELRGMPWSRPGDRVYLFLQHVPEQEAGHYYQIHPSGRILVEGERARAFDADPGPGVQQLTGAGPSEVATRIRQATQRAAAAHLPPQRREMVRRTTSTTVTSNNMTTTSQGG